MAGLFGNINPGSQGGLLGLLFGSQQQPDQQQQTPQAQQSPQLPGPMLGPQNDMLGRLSAAFHNLANPQTSTAGGLFDALGGMSTGQRTDPQGVQMQLLGAAMQSLPANMPIAQKLAILQNPKVQESLYGLTNVGNIKTPGGYEMPAITNGQGGVGMFSPSASQLQTVPGATMRDLKPGDQLVDVANPGGGGSPGGGMQNTTGLLDQGTVDFYAKQLLAGDTSVLQNLGRTAMGAQNIVAIRQKAAQLAHQSGIAPEENAARRAEFGGFESTQKTLGNRLGNISLAINEAQQLIPQALDASRNLPNQTEYLPVNKMIQAYQENTGDPNVVKLGAALYGLIHAYARGVNPSGQIADADINRATKILDQALSKKQLSAGVQQLYTELQQMQKSPGAVKEELRKNFTGAASLNKSEPDKNDPLGVRFGQSSNDPLGLR